MKSILKEVKESMKVESELDSILQELNSTFKKLGNADYNCQHLRKMQIIASHGTRPRLYSEENLLEMREAAKLLSEQDKVRGKIGKLVYTVCEDIMKGKYDGMIMTEFSSNPKYYPTKKLFTAFQNNYNDNSIL